MVSQAQQRAINKYHKKNYKTIATKVKIDKYEEIQEMLKSRGIDSMSKFVTMMIEEELKKENAK